MVLRINLLNRTLNAQQIDSRGNKMALKDIVTSPWTWALTLGAAALIGVGITRSNRNQTSLEQRVTEKQEFFAKFGTPENNYSDSRETYGIGLALFASLEKENGKKLTDGDKLYFLETFVNKDREDGVSPKELSDYINGKKVDGTDRKWAKDLKPVETKENGFAYTFKVDYDPTQLPRLNKIIEKHAAVRHVPNDDMWRYHAMKWAAENFSKDNYLNADAMNKYEAHVNKVEESLK
jgi:hypothetical protein